MAAAWARWGVPLALAAVVLGLVLATTWSRPPTLPADADHSPAASPAQCLSCHGSGRAHPRTPAHPRNDRCAECHVPAGR